MQTVATVNSLGGENNNYKPVVMVVADLKRCGFRRRFENLAALRPPLSPLVLEAASLIASLTSRPALPPARPPLLDAMTLFPGSSGLGVRGGGGLWTTGEDGVRVEGTG